jgi:hypothetical protein
VIDGVFLVLGEVRDGVVLIVGIGDIGGAGFV